MTTTELLKLCRFRLRHGGGIQLVTPEQRQPLLGMRGELLCVNARGHSVYRYSVRQTRRILRDCEASSTEAHETDAKDHS